MRSIARALAGFALLAVLQAGCSPRPGEAAGLPPSLSREAAERVVLAADDARRRAFAEGQTEGLPAAFGARALRALQDQVARMRVRGMQLEESEAERRLVFWDARAAESVLQVMARQRLITPTQEHPPWQSTARQWWARLVYAGGSWLVADQQDLPPDRWRQDPGSGAP
jgi:hypothetical protein